jgi:hypothetical protein
MKARHFGRLEWKLLGILIVTFIFLFPCVASAAWNIETVDDNGGDFRFTSLALDIHSNPHISYINYNHAGLMYATKNTTNWQIEVVDSSGYTGYFTSLDLDKFDNPHIVYFNNQESNLEYTWKNESGWQYDNPPTNGRAAWAMAPLKVGNDGYPQIIMADRLNGELQYFWKNDTGWYSEIIPDTRYASYTDLILDVNNKPCVSFVSDAGGNTGVLKYAVKEPTGWYNEVVDDSVTSWGAETSIRLDKNGYPRISYYDRSNLDLRYAWRDSSSWHVETADFEGDVGDQSSLYLDSMGFPHISYYDTSDTALKYSWKNESGWQNEIVEDGGIGMGWHSSLVLNTTNQPYISYGDYSNSSLKLAWNKNSPAQLKYYINTITNSGGNIIPSGVVEAIQGESKTFNIIPNSGYYIDKVLIDGKSVGNISSYTFDNINTNHTVNVKFVQIQGTILKIQSNPVGASVYVDKKLKGITPLSLSDIAPGTHTIGLTLPGYENWSKNVKIVKNIVNTIDIKLKPIQTGSISIESNPQGASIILDGEPTGKRTPSLISLVETGKHQIKLFKSGFKTWEKTIEVKSNSTENVRATLKKD